MNLNVQNVLFETATELVKDPTPNKLLEFLEFAWVPLLEVGLGLLIGPWIKKLIGKMAVHSQDKALMTFLGSTANVLIIGLAFIMAAEQLGVKMNSVLSIVTALGLGVSLAIKGNMANVAGGIQILVTKPFKIGDYIRISPHKGYVTSLELMFTTIRTDNGKEVIIPNSTVIEDMIINYSKYPSLRIRVPFQVKLGIDYAALKQTILTLMKSNPYLEQNEPVTVTTKSITTSGVTLELVGYVKVENMERCKHHIYDLLTEGLPVYNTSTTSLTQIQMVNPIEVAAEETEKRPDASSQSSGPQKQTKTDTPLKTARDSQNSQSETDASNASQSAAPGQSSPSSSASSSSAQTLAAMQEEEEFPEILDDFAPGFAINSLPDVQKSASSRQNGASSLSGSPQTAAERIQPLFDQDDFTVEADEDNPASGK